MHRILRGKYEWDSVFVISADAKISQHMLKYHHALCLSNQLLDKVSKMERKHLQIRQFVNNNTFEKIGMVEKL